MHTASRKAVICDVLHISVSRVGLAEFADRLQDREKRSASNDCADQTLSLVLFSGIAVMQYIMPFGREVMEDN